MEYDSAQYLEWKSYPRVIPYARNSEGDIWAMHTDNNKS